MGIRKFCLLVCCGGVCHQGCLLIFRRNTKTSQKEKKKLQFAGKSSSAKNHQSIFRNSDSQEGWDGGTVREGSQRKRETKNVVKGIHRKKKKTKHFHY